VSPQPGPERMTSREFVEWARRQPGRPRYELVAGELVAMSPERVSHNRVKLDVALALRRAVEAAGLPCQVFTDGMAVEIDEDTTYEPDATVRCGESLPDDAVVVPDPLIVVEVVSPSSGGVDSGAKLADYFRLPSVRHYLIVRPRQLTVVHHRRGNLGPGGPLETRILRTGALRLEPPGVELALADLFA
jgi:Uma2 family endonuclease